MPRTLPWLKATSATEKSTRRSHVPSKGLAPKQIKDSESASSNRALERDERNKVSMDQPSIPNFSSSPAKSPDTPDKVYMIDGMDHDDRFRMVEDELMDIAKSFTTHLHAAEYKRQKALAKSRNAEAIHSISRPVTQKMPDQTRRKVEGRVRAKQQRETIQKLSMGGSSHSEDLESEEDLPYIGTTLHGLMDSPSRKAVSLARVRPMNASTRAAAGKRVVSIFRSRNLESPSSKKGPKNSYQSNEENTTQSSNDDDDLDAPVPIPQFMPSEQDSNHSQKPLAPSHRRANISSDAQTENPESRSLNKVSMSRPTTSFSATGQASSDIQARIARRKEATRSLKIKNESERLDIIPTFLNG